MTNAKLHKITTKLPKEKSKCAQESWIIQIKVGIPHRFHHYPSYPILCPDQLTAYNIVTPLLYATRLLHVHPSNMCSPHACAHLLHVLTTYMCSPHAFAHLLHVLTSCMCSPHTCAHLLHVLTSCMCSPLACAHSFMCSSFACAHLLYVLDVLEEPVTVLV